MQPKRLLTFLFALILFAVSLAAPTTVVAQQFDDEFPTELNTNHKEPAIELPEHKGPSPYRRISHTRRQPSSDKLVQLCQEAVNTTARRMLSTDQHTPWQIMHALLGLREEFQILHDGAPVSGLNWVSEGQVFTNEYWFEKTKFGGRAHPYSVPYAFEGHANQFLAILSMCGVGLDHTLGTANGPVSMREMIRHAQMTVSTKDEPTWTLWFLSRYLPSNARWRNQQGEAWSIEKLVQIQTNKPMQGAPCGGTHSLFALAHARNVYLRQGKPLRGVWMQAEWKIRKHINTARMQQNSNGTLSSNFFRGKKYDPDFNKRMASAGHVLEFLMIALPQKELNQRWVRRAIEATARDLMDNRKAFVKCSPLYHSVNALNIYLDRVNPKTETEELASDHEDRRTVQAPQPTQDAATRLRSVPFRGISQGRDTDGSEVADEPAAGDVAMNRDSAKQSESADAGDTQSQPALKVQAKPLKRTPTVPNSLSAKAPSAAEIRADADRWKATSPKRRLPFVVPPEKENAEESLPPLPRMQKDSAATTPSSKIPSDTPSQEKSDESGNSDSSPQPADAINGALMDLDAAGTAESKAPAVPTDESSSDNKSSGNRSSVPVKSVSMPRPVAIVPFTDAERTVNSLAVPLAIPAPAATPEPVITPEPAVEEGPAATPIEADAAEMQPQPTSATGADSSATEEVKTSAAETSAENDDTEAELPEGQRSKSATLSTLTIEPAEEVEADPDTDGPVAEPTDSKQEAPTAQQTASPKAKPDQDKPATDDQKQSATIPDGINDRFLDPDLDPSEWVNRFEIESREVFAARGNILKAVDLKPGMSIADVGAGTGLYVGLFSKEVGTEGRVYAVDISPRLVDFVRRRVKAEELHNVEVIQSDEKSTKLGDRKVDRVFVCDTYHHFEYYQLMLASILDALKPGGELILIDFNRIPGTSREWVVNHVRADKQTFRAEVEAAGFEFIDEVRIPEFKENYLLRFRKPVK